MPMTAARESIHGQWSSRWIFVLAATGSAVGLGNIWRFPYITGESGGGAFVLVYLLCVALVGLPIMMAEILLGRRGRRSPINTMAVLAEDEGLRPSWRYLGWMGVLAGFVILSFYSVVAGWAVAYIVYVASGTFAGATIETSQGVFDGLIGSAASLVWWHSLFMVLVVVVVARGVQGGLEQAVKYLMPALFAMLLLLVGYALFSGDALSAVHYLFDPDFSKITGDAVLAALGQAFFSLSLGMGSIMIYGSYLPNDASIPQTSIIIAGADTLVALLAGLAIFPIVFGYGLEPGQGPGLVFITLTIAFGHMPGGQFFGGMFFVLLTVAAWTSAISLLEPVAAWMVESFGWSRLKACLVGGGGAWLLGIGSALSFNHWAGFAPAGRNFFDWSEFLSTNVLLPLGGMLIAVFAGWRMRLASTMEEMGSGPSVLFRAWLGLVLFVAPVGVLVVFLEGTGLRALLVDGLGRLAATVFG
ncbi:MAG: sodium-dependent transporter [Gammaproteobacteria bacterium]